MSYFIKHRPGKAVLIYVAVLMAFNPVLPSFRRAYETLWPGTFATALVATTAVLGGALLVWLWSQGRLRDGGSWTWVLLVSGVMGGVASTFEDTIELVHLPEYGALAILWCRVLGSRVTVAGTLGRKAPWRSAWLIKAALAAAAVGVLDELVQAALPQRVYDTRDVVYNAIGALLGVLAYWGIWLSKDDGVASSRA